MKIFIAEEINGQRQPERAFEGPVVRAGRDARECEIVFDPEAWPMVSRQHAEFRFQENRWLIVDKKSRFGTLVDGQPLTGPTEVVANSRIQFGPGGPALCVVRVELSSQPVAAPLSDPHLPTMNMPANVVAPPATIPAAPAKSTPVGSAPENAVSLDLVSNVTGELRRFLITKDVTYLGRDPGAEVRIEAEAAAVSRRHAAIERHNDAFRVIDQNSFNGTFLNEQRLLEPAVLGDGDRIQLGIGGPVLRFRDSSKPQKKAVPPANATQVAPSGSKDLQGFAASPDQHQVVNRRAFQGEAPLSIGRAPDNDLTLDGLQISNHHARVTRKGNEAFIEDLGSTNGVYVNGSRISAKVRVQSKDTIQIGPFVLQIDGQGVAVFDTRAKTRIDAVDITKIVPNRSGGGPIKLLDDVDLTIPPNEFVGLLGPSGAGKSTLMDSLNGMRPATSGHVLINNQDLYQNLDSLKQSIGYVPQDDIIHRELTVYRTLYYIAQLRLSRDVSRNEIDQIVNEVMDVTGLSERRDVPVGQLSGGQRKRVSIAVELITKPSVIFLDEPTSGLDPATEEKVMKLFRQIAESGRTVVLTTHAMENVKLFDKIVVMMRGKLVFYGAPEEALAHVKAESFKDLYDKLEAPIEERLAAAGRSEAAPGKTPGPRKDQIAEEVAEDWKQRFMRTEQYKLNVQQPLLSLKGKLENKRPERRRFSVTDSLRQWKTLSQRYMEVLRHDKFNLFILFAQAPVVAFLTYLVVDQKDPRDFPYFVLALVAVWFGTSVAAREIIRERAVYNRERMVNLGLMPYVGSKLFVLAIIVGLQCALLFGTLRLFHVAGLMAMPGDHFGVTQLLVMVLTGMVGISLGLFISAIVKTSEMATSLVPLILIPQILFSGLVGVPKATSKYVGALMPATWSFDEMKRLTSDLGVLRGKDEEAMPSATNEGRGLYKEIKHQNDLIIEQKQLEVEDYKARAEKKFEDFDKEMNDYQKRLEKWNMTGRQGAEPKKPVKPKLDPVPAKANVAEIPDSLHNYIDFLHPWGGSVLDVLILLTMFIGLTLGTIVALRSQDIG